MKVSTNRRSASSANGVSVAPGCSPTRWWRGIAAPNFHVMALGAMQAAIEKVEMLGDTCQGLVKSIERLRRAYPSPTEIVMVAGNHELWSKKSSFEEHFDDGHAAAEVHDVHLLENAVQVIRGVRILGATLWTDYELYGPGLREAAMRTAADTMLDHKRIKWSRDPWARFRPAEARIMHFQSRMFFEEELAKPHAGPSVCVSHHAMTLDAIAPAHRRSILSAAYASEMQPMIDHFQPIWSSPAILITASISSEAAEPG
jgi:hypothetical protein